MTFICAAKQSEPPYSFPVSTTNLISVDNPNGKQWVNIHELNEGLLLHYYDNLNFYIQDEVITAYTDEFYDPAILEGRFLRQVYKLWLHTRGILGFHASAVSIKDKAVLFSAYSHSGKSSLASSCMQAGHALLADDFAVLRSGDGCYFVQPSYPQMRMWHDQARIFIKDYDKLEDIRDDYPKKLVPIGDEGFGRFSKQARPLKVIYIPQRRQQNDPNKKITITPLPSVLAVTTLMRSGFILFYRKWLPFHQQNVQLLAELVKIIPVRQINYPSGYDLLPTVRDAILADIEQLP